MWDSSHLPYSLRPSLCLTALHCCTRAAAAAVAFVQGLLRALGVSQAVVVGHSAGATVSVDLALRCDI